MHRENRTTLDDQSEGEVNGNSKYLEGQLQVKIMKGLGKKGS